MIPRGALLQAMEALGFGPADQQRIVDAVEGVLADSTEAIGGGVSAERFAEATATNCPATARIEIEDGAA